MYGNLKYHRKTRIYSKQGLRVVEICPIFSCVGTTPLNETSPNYTGQIKFKLVRMMNANKCSVLAECQATCDELQLDMSDC